MLIQATQPPATSGLTPETILGLGAMVSTLLAAAIGIAGTGYLERLRDRAAEKTERDRALRGVLTAALVFQMTTHLLRVAWVGAEPASA